jgi:broad specificity phosphatase PhoE
LGSLLVVRHGQASFHDEDYDNLSELGVEQARRLGAYLAHSKREVDVLVSGPLRRQLDTAEHMRRGAQQAGSALPEATVSDAWTEYPAIELLTRGLPIIAERDDEVREILEEAKGELRSLASVPPFELLFNKIRVAWMTGELALDGVETFVEFRTRVHDGLRALLDDVGDKRAAVVTSGGPVGLVLQQALSLDDEIAMQMTAVVTNSSVTVVRQKRGTIQLLSFNTLPHLRERKLVTFR